MPEETHEERINRELIELLNELRVVLPGVQVLFAFLLTVPFTNRFGEVTDLQQTVYMAALLCAAAGSALLIAPSSYHRLRFRQRDKEQMLRTSNRLVLGGMGFLALGIAASVFLIADVLYGGATVAAVTAAAALTLAWFWYGLPLTRRAQDDG